MMQTEVSPAFVMSVWIRVLLETVTHKAANYFIVLGW